MLKFNFFLFIDRIANNIVILSIAYNAAMVIRCCLPGKNDQRLKINFQKCKNKLRSHSK